MCGFEERARNNFLKGYSCAQSVLAAFAEPMGMTEETALKVSSSFGAGFGRLREVCGAFASLMLLHGMLEGYADPSAESKAAHYAKVQVLAERFRGEMGSIICRDILGEETASTHPVPDARNAAYYASRPCLKCVELAARMGAEMIEAKKVQKS